MSWSSKGFLLVAALIAVVLLGMRWRSPAEKDSSESKPGAAQDQSPLAPLPKQSGESEQVLAVSKSIATSIDDDPVGLLRLEGQVLDEHGDAVGGARVSLGSSPPQTTTSDDDGSFAFSKLVERRYSVHARSSDLVGQSVFVRLTAHSDPVIIVMRPGVGVTVEVANDLSEPIVGAIVSFPKRGVDSEPTDARGETTIDNLAPGSQLMSAAARGYATTTIVVPISRSTTTRGHLRIVLREGFAVSGVVIDERGEPVVNAKMIARPLDRIVNLEDPETQGIATDDSGRFRFAAVAPGSTQIVVVHSEMAPAASETLEVRDSPITGISITMKRGAVVEGFVVNRDGAEVPWASVHIWSAKGEGQVDRSKIANEQGRFLIRGLPRERLTLRAKSERAGSHEVRADLRNRDSQKNLEIVLDVEGSISGVVVNEKGEAVPEIQVVARPALGEGFDMASMRGLRSSVATSDGDGRFTLQGLPDGGYRVNVRRSRSQGRTAGVPAKTGDRQVRLLLATRGRVVGEVQLDNGASPELATVSMDGGASVVSEQGKFRIDDVAPGAHQLLVRGPDFRDKIVKIEVGANETLDVGKIVTKAGGSLFGRVLDSSGQAIEGAQIAVSRQVLSDGGSLIPKGIGNYLSEQAGARLVKSDQQGAYRVRGLGEGPFTVVADHPQHGRSLAHSLKSAGKHQQLDLSLLLVGSVRGTLLVNGKSRPGVQILMSPTSGAAHIIMVSTDKDGAFLAKRVAPGETKVSAMLGVGVSMAATTVMVQSGKQVEARVEIDEGDIELTVTIAGKEDPKISAAQVFLFPGEVAPHKGSELNKLFLNAAASAKIAFALGGSPAKFSSVNPGEFSVCVIPIDGDINDPTFAAKLERHVSDLAVYCFPLKVAGTPLEQSKTIEVPPMTPFPEDAD